MPSQLNSFDRHSIKGFLRQKSNNWESGQLFVLNEIIGLKIGYMGYIGIVGQLVGRPFGAKRKSAGKIGTLREILWAHQGTILGPPDYESGALTN